MAGLADRVWDRELTSEADPPESEARVVSMVAASAAEQGPAESRVTEHRPDPEVAAVLAERVPACSHAQPYSNICLFVGRIGNTEVSRLRR